MLDVAAKSIGLSATSDDQYVLSKSAGAYLMEICREVSAILEADDKTRQDNNTKQNEVNVQSAASHTGDAGHPASDPGAGLA